MVKHLSEYDSLFVSSNQSVIKKVKAAICRLEQPLELQEDYKNAYISYLKKNTQLVIPVLIKSGDVASISFLVSVGALPAGDINNYIEVANKHSQTEILAILLDYQNKKGEKETLSTITLDYKKPSSEWEVQENEDGSLTISKYLGKNLDVTIPSRINGKKVRSIESCSIGWIKVSVFFTHKDKVQSVIIDDGIGVIDERAFLECRKLKSVFIPNSVTTIGKEAFSDCKNLNSVMISERVVEIGVLAFANCASLTSIQIPDSVTEIKRAAFWGCNNLTSIVITACVKKIGEYAFDDCPNLLIHSPKGSYAIEYAKENVIKYVET